MPDPSSFRLSTIFSGREADNLHLLTDLKTSSPYTDYEYVTVTFLAANTDFDVAHHLSPPTPEDVDYQVVRADRSTTVYNDGSGTRRAWGNGYITLRSSTATANVTLLLTIRRVG